METRLVPKFLYDPPIATLSKFIHSPTYMVEVIIMRA